MENETINENMKTDELIEKPKAQNMKTANAEYRLDPEPVQQLDALRWTE